MVRSSVEETLNGLLDAEADSICRAQRYERSPERNDTRAGHYERKLGTKAGEVTLRVPSQQPLRALGCQPLKVMVDVLLQEGGASKVSADVC